MFLLPYRAIFVWPWKMVSASVRYLFYQPMDEKIKTWPLRFLSKENRNMEKALFDWPIVLQYDVKAKYRLISRKFSGMKFFHPSVRLTNQKPRVYPFDQPVKWVYSRSFVVSALFARFHFKVIRKSLYRCIPLHPPFSPIHFHSRFIPFHSIRCLFTVIPFLWIPFTVFFIPIFSILFTVYFQLNFIPSHFIVHCLLSPFPFRSLLS